MFAQPVTREQHTNLAYLPLSDTQAVDVNSIPHNYSQLKQCAIDLEYVQEYQKLQQLSELALDKTSLENQFKELCQQRETRIKDTCLSFQASPESACNRLYWQMAINIFSPTSLEEMLAIVQPSVKIKLDIDVVISPREYQSSLRQRLHIRVKKTNINLPENTLGLSGPGVLSQYIIVDNCLLDLEQIKSLSLDLHRQLLHKLNDTPQLQTKLYTHNNDFRALLQNINLLEKEGLTPAQVLEELIEVLIRSGTRYTGHNLAATPALIACAQFRSYLDGLPEKFRQQLMEMESYYSPTTLEKTLEKLDSDPDNCGETTAEILSSIKDNVKNKLLLAQHPNFSAEQLRVLHKKYRHTQLNTTGFDVKAPIPTDMSSELLKRLKIESVYDYLDIMISIPTEQYELFILSAELISNPPLPFQLAEGLKMLIPPQRQKLFDIILANIEKFGGIKAVIRFAILTGDIKFFEQTFARLSNDEKNELLDDLDKENNSILHIAALSGNHHIYHTILTLYPEPQRAERVKRKNKAFESVLYLLAGTGKLDSFCETLELYKDDDREFAFLEMNKLDEIMLFNAVKYSNPDTMEYIVSHHPSFHLPDYVCFTNKDKDTIIHAISEHGDFKYIQIILSKIEQCHHAKILNHPNESGDSILHITIERGKPERLQAALALYPDEDRFNAIFIEDKNGDSVLELAEKNKNPQFLLTILDSLSPRECHDAINRLKNPNADYLHPFVNPLEQNISHN